jgi:hypothetical protein
MMRRQPKLLQKDGTVLKFAYNTLEKSLALKSIHKIKEKVSSGRRWQEQGRG